MTEPSYVARRAAAQACLSAGDPAGAFRELRGTLWYPRRVAPDQLADALGVMARIFVVLGQRELAERAAQASLEPLDPDALYELGFQLIEDGLPAIAATVLGRCLELAPGTEQIVTELVAALERELAYADARAVLEAHPALVEQSFLCRYLLAYDAAMSGDLATTARLAPTLIADEPVHALMADRIDAILARAASVRPVTRLDATDLRGWHYVLAGGLLTHLSPHGFDEPMHGRYAWLQDSLPRVRTGLDRLIALLARWGLTPPCVYPLPGRDHEAVGHAAAALLGVPVAPWPAVGVPAPGLIVAYDLATVPARELARLVERRPEQLVYAHATVWTEDGAIAADVTTLLHQSLVAPWSSQLVLDPTEVAPRTAEPDPRDAAALGAAIAASAPLPADELHHDDEPGLLALADAVGLPDRGRRERAWAGSPVASNRFV